MKLPLRILVLCTANSARSQITEALLRAGGGARIVAGSAGTAPAERVNPGALAVLAENGIAVAAGRPKQVDDVLDQGWDVVITVCDDAKESCPILPGATLSAHWGVPDPAGAPNEPEAFRAAFRTLSHRVDRLLELPLEELDAAGLRSALEGIGRESE